ncbi:hypothetical protein BJ138DRAFT_1019348 [Hygrophoropsis aurantiaca]|uniref:Uncharacterized protein n=1 Tax=Hygrophoropsis aurantiaca TaxID=72124 RepID=A0ACB7ZTT8_9AGAM|nr:hypothetical protein BJ138DRAFT_1019348 [Hygrophoropsis aurantiaca]
MLNLQPPQKNKHPLANGQPSLQINEVNREVATPAATRAADDSNVPELPLQPSDHSCGTGAPTPIISQTEANSSSWAARNPGKPIIPTRSAPPPPNAAQLASRKLASDQKKKKDDLLHFSLKAIKEEQEEKLSEVASTHDVAIEKVYRLFNGYQNLAPSRKAQLANALIHAKAAEVNKNRPTGSKYKANEIRELIKNDPAMQNLDSDQEESFINELNEFRKLQKFGMRANNAAAARDMLSTLDNVCKALDSMVRRTGGYAIFFATRGHVNDTSEPTWHGTDNAMDFFEDVLDLEPDEVCRKFEQWACTRNESKSTVKNASSCSCYSNTSNYTDGITGKSKKVSMNYDNYETKIMRNLNVKLVGWPTGIPFTSPSKINTVTEIRKLRDALKDGTCHWVAMSAAEIEEHAKSLATRIADGVTIGKPRAPRADRGKTRGKRTVQGKANNRPSKRAKSATQRKGKGPTSRETIEDTEDDESVPSGSDDDDQ